MSLLSLDDAQRRLLALAPSLPVETVSLAAAAGRWATEDLIASRSQPARDLSSMDGYAIRFVDLPGPWRIIGESAAGRGLDHAVGAGEAARIFTGAPLPDGADTILIQEDAAAAGETLRLSGGAPVRAGLFVRPARSDFAEGAPLIRAGDRLTPANIALAAIGGHGALPCKRRARVALISTGDELVAPGSPAEGVRLPSSNAPMLAALLARLPVDVTDLGIVRDDVGALSDAFTRAAAEADIVVTTGGASVGDHDLVRPALEDAGAALDFWRVAMKPGKPLMAGRLGAATMIGLPGNPVSAFVTALLFVLPLVRSAMGARDPFPARRTATLAEALPAGGERAEFLRGHFGSDGVRAFAGQDSAALTILAAADVLIVRCAHAAPLSPGEQVEIIDLA